jgi:hypothetical protein
MNPIQAFFAFIARRRAERIHAREAKRAEVISRQIEERKRRHKAWRPLIGELSACKRVMLECELRMRRV